MITHALTLSFGPELTGLLLLIAHEIRSISIGGNFMTGGHYGDLRAWLEDEGIFEAAAYAIKTITEAVRPVGKPNRLTANWPQDTAGTLFADDVQNKLRGLGGSAGVEAARIRELFGPEIVKRIASEGRKS